MRRAALRLSDAVRRSVHFVPGNNRKFLDKALAVRPDSIILDLEDSVPVADKQAGRDMVRSWLNDASTWGDQHPEICVRINCVNSPYWRDDIEAALVGTATTPRVLVVPKVAHGDDLVFLEGEVAAVEKSASLPQGQTKFMVIATELPESIFNLRSIAMAPRVAALTWGCEDLSAELAALRTRRPDKRYLDVFQHVRTMTLLAARAAGVQAIDGIYTDLNDAAGLEEEAAEARDSGFDGKLSIHPGQIPVINRVFTPSEEEIEECKELISLFEANADKGAFRYKGQMVDKPHVRRARALLSRGGVAVSAETAAPSVET